MQPDTCPPAPNQPSRPSNDLTNSLLDIARGVCELVPQLHIYTVECMVVTDLTAEQIKERLKDRIPGLQSLKIKNVSEEVKDGKVG